MTFSLGVSRFVLLLLLLLLLFIVSSAATEVTWTAADETTNDPAATAPKSQRYWDEHNIPRPDYAKTDAEILAEQGTASEGTLKWWLFRIFLVLVLVVAPIGYFIVWPRILHGRGQTLGSSSSSSSITDVFSWITRKLSKSDPALARQARLSRFETANNSKKEKKME